MTLFQQIRFKFIWSILVIGIAGVRTTFALQIEAPKEIEEHVLAYSIAAGPAENRDAILKVSILENAQCGNVFIIKLINKNNGKAIKEIERCFTNLPNEVLQNGIFELLGHDVKTETTIGGGAKTVFLGIGFVAAGLVLYYTKQPKPVYIPSKNAISEVSK